MASVDPCLPYLKPNWVGVEIGVQWGTSALALIEHGVRFIYLVDPWVTYEGYGSPGPEADRAEDENFWVFRRNMAKYDDGRHFAIIRAHSEEAPRFIPNELDFVWIDGNHYYRWVRRDIEMYWPKVRAGGILCGHDYGTEPWFDVNRAVDQFAVGKNLLLPQPTCWLIRKE